MKKMEAGKPRVLRVFISRLQATTSIHRKATLQTRYFDSVEDWLAWLEETHADMLSSGNFCYDRPDLGMWQRGTGYRWSVLQRVGPARR